MFQFSINSAEELGEYFRNLAHNKKLEQAARGVNVSASIRCEWMLGHYNVTIHGRIRQIEFKNLGGGVWVAKLVESF